jgi:uncharacterized protein (TIGR03435 family)
MKSWTVRAMVLACCLAVDLQSFQKLAFEVASIKPAQPPPMGKMMVRMDADASMLRYTNVSLRDCIRVAFGVRDYQIEGPDWLGGDRFDMVAKLPAGSSKDQIPDMLQSLLEGRFGLKLRRATKEHAIYALVAAKGGAKLKPAEFQTAEAPSGRTGNPKDQMFIMMSPEGAHLKAPSSTLANLAEMLSHFTERPVVDMTHIQGQYDFDLVFSPENMRDMMKTPMGPMPVPPSEAGKREPQGGPEQRPDMPADSPDNAGTIFDAVQHYGLKLEPRRAPLEILVIEHVNKMPNEN